MDYQKINTLFKRDDNNIIIPSEFTCEEFEYLKDLKFRAEEKIDGTNIHIDIVETVYGYEIEYYGRTIRANIPDRLLEYLKSIPKELLIDVATNGGKHLPRRVSIYGEGYGAKIQNGSNYLGIGVGFIIFDIMVDDVWLKRNIVEEIANKLNLLVVPVIGYFTIQEAVDFVSKGFKSTVAQNKNYDAEGLVLKTDYGLLDRLGRRIIFKIKHCDFIKYKQKYGEIQSW